MKPYIQFIGETNANAADYAIYPASINACSGGTVYMADDGDADVLVSVGGGLPFAGESGVAFGKAYTVSALNHDTAQKLRAAFTFCAPSPVLSRDFTVGVGDRLGIASPGHIRVFAELGGTPVLAQQSIRELNLTERTFEDVLDCATFAVYRTGWRGGYGADGDHLKKPDEVRYALDCGYTMITLDCSEHIRNDISRMTDEQALTAYTPDPVQTLLYEGRSFHVGDMTLTFDRLSLARMALIYNGAIDFAVSIYEQFFKGNANVDFEISIDETETPTAPLQHFFIANELTRRGVRFATLAPRFCGEFQKGVDYIGDLAQFETEFAAHEAIAESFGYKLSVHSGSDKFSVFPIVGRLSRCRVHVKTAGTNWLEAMRVVAERDPALYRTVHKYALSRFADAKKFYHVTTDLTKVPDVDTLKDADLPGLFDENNARQLIHITYGFILGAKNPDGTRTFKDALYALWRREADAYADRLAAHIGRHVRLLKGEA